MVALIEVLLDKDPKGRFQTPGDLLKVMPMITEAIEGGVGHFQAFGRRLWGILTPRFVSPGKTGPEKISIAKLPVTGSRCFWTRGGYRFPGQCLGKQDVNIVTTVAWAGVGKSTLVNHWLRRMATARLCFG